MTWVDIADVRVEDYLFEKLDKKRDRLNNTELLGQDMIDAGTDFGPGTSYGTLPLGVVYGLGTGTLGMYGSAGYGWSWLS